MPSRTESGWVVVGTSYAGKRIVKGLPLSYALFFSRIFPKKMFECSRVIAASIPRTKAAGSQKLCLKKQVCGKKFGLEGKDIALL